MLGIYCRTSKDGDLENSTIIQQKIAGIKFAEYNNFDYDVFIDEGKSGFKIYDDADPFNHRPEFTRLVNDIKDKKIDKVWVWEQSRLSRNHYASAIIFRLFEKYKILLYENNKQFDLNDPQIKFTMQIMGAVSELERQLIVARTTRGSRKRIDEGKRAHVKLYGYGKSGKDEKGYTVWIPIESEINTIQYALKRYMEGVSLSKVCSEIYDMNKIDKKLALRRAFTLGKILRRYQYTGFQLTIEGNDIFKKFRKNEIENIQILLDKKYWVKSHNYPVEIISIENWVKLCERLQILSKNRLITKRDKLLRADKDIATGIIECAECGVKFYYKDQISRKKSGYTFRYLCYYHLSTITKSICKQHPRSFKLEHINEIFKIFYFFFLIVFDNKNEQIKESMRNIKQTKLKVKEKITKHERESAIIEKRLLKFNNLLDKIDEEEMMKTIIRQINDNEKRYNDLNVELSKLKIEYELQNQKFNKVELEMTYYDVQDRVNDWFFKINVEEQRNEIIRVVKTCKIFNHHIIIDTGKIIFLFDINQHYVFDMNLLNNLNRGYVYKEYFTKSTNKREAKTFDGKRILEVNLEQDNIIKIKTFEYLIQNFNIYYNLVGKTKLIAFVSLKGLYSTEINMPE